MFAQTEDYQVAPGKDSVHGYNGRLKVSYGGVFTNIGKDFLSVGEKYDPSRPISEDPNDLFNVNVHGVCRSSDASSSRPSLTIDISLCSDGKSGLVRMVNDPMSCTTSSTTRSAITSPSKLVTSSSA